MKDKLQDALKTALKAKDKVTLDTIRGILSAIQYEEMQKNADRLSPEQTLEVLKRERKKRVEELEFAEKANRSDAQETLRQELATIDSFLPKQLSETELEEILTKFKASNPEANMGLAMKFLKQDYAGQYDGKLASQIAKRTFG